MAYSPERKAAVLKRLLPPSRIPLARLAQEGGISEATLSKWRREAREKGQLIPDADTGPEGWTAATVRSTARRSKTRGVLDGA